jgi:hypothetical protein
MDGQRPNTPSPRNLIERTRQHLQTLPSFRNSVDEANRVDIVVGRSKVKLPNNIKLLGQRSVTNGEDIAGKCLCGLVW